MYSEIKRQLSSIEALLNRQDAKIEQLRAALSDVLPLAERYVGRSDGAQDATHDKIANARRALSFGKESDNGG